MAIVELKNISFSYTPEQEIIHDLSLAFDSGSATAIVGQNGAGKTTTVKLINHLLIPSQGQVLINGHDSRELTTAKVSQQVGYAFQNPDDQIFNNSIRKEIAYGPKENGIKGEALEKKVIQAAELTGLRDFLDEHPYNFPYSLRKFITIASLVAMDPDVYIFDEPTAGQDHISRQRLAGIIKTLKSQGKCIIIITHDMNFVAENFQRVVVLSEHKILRDGTPQEIFTDTDLMTRANIEPPAVLNIANQARLSAVPLTVAELVNAL
ncbi:energy-coupling factor ABC transporter ATP-binding protein [Levilactobacillus tujiorum]|uniref:Energy-coupling factor ABC transporter ATP-binding protein n=1 Tax=Levilactobacillus tujiorum TaxID=2912243 RepID=A0ABX1L419_9LACO|nr:energy-coupling factor ABC transporter ATP-binding protein [Levilactobacillus tujiorum]MCH5465487.1 energy-coupling factor ABC transporter ATP-binding protein [Levilactobacillus tujiorum]NLR12573.1 energy-coupling factor ABC transporter ATP-binding protein [Lactobacillus sp. HBUAS51387]NLR29776.1 energy-coupling factor ABC transporter ATP-binding protein [Levilactobacillus tujiorum]